MMLSSCAQGAALQACKEALAASQAALGAAEAAGSALTKERDALAADLAAKAAALSGAQDALAETQTELQQHKAEAAARAEEAKKASALPDERLHAHARCQGCSGPLGKDHTCSTWFGVSTQAAARFWCHLVSSCRAAMPRLN